MLEEGAGVARRDNSLQSAKEIVARILVFMPVQLIFMKESEAGLSTELSAAGGKLKGYYQKRIKNIEHELDKRQEAKTEADRAGQRTSRNTVSYLSDTGRR